MIFRLPLIVWSLLAYVVLMPLVFVIDAWRNGVSLAASNFALNSQDWWTWARTGKVEGDEELHSAR